MKDKQLCYSTLATDRNAKCPEGISRRQFAAVRFQMEQRFAKEFMDTPDGLYTSKQIWTQIFKKFIQNN